MAAELELDKIQDNMLVQDGLIYRFVRTGMVKGLAAVAGSEQEFLWSAAAVSGMPDMNTSLSATHPTLLLVKRQFVPLSDSLVRVFLVYETPQGFPLTTFLVRNDTQMVTYRTNLIPGSNRTPIYVNGFTDPNSGEKFTGDNVMCDLLRPMRQLSVSALVFGSPQNDGGDGVGQVNNAPWPLTASGVTAKPIGYWLINRFTTTQSKYAGYYTVEAGCLSRVTEDWSEYGVLRNTQTGRYAKLKSVAGDSSSYDYVHDAIASGAYQYGVIYQPANHGVVRFGPYQTSNFSTYFTFA